MLLKCRPIFHLVQGRLHGQRLLVGSVTVQSKKVVLVNTRETHMIQEARKKHGMMMADSEPETDLPVGPVDPMSPTSPPLYPSAKRLCSFVWEFFGYPKQLDGSIKDDGEPTCKLCNRKLVARSVNTSNMMSHLHEWHKKEYAQLKSKKVR